MRAGGSISAHLATVTSTSRMATRTGMNVPRSRKASWMQLSSTGTRDPDVRSASISALARPEVEGKVSKPKPEGHTSAPAHEHKNMGWGHHGQVAKGILCALVKQLKLME
jgi:hypothetical protein